MIRSLKLAAALFLSLGFAAAPVHAERTDKAAVVKAYRAQIGARSFAQRMRGNGFQNTPWMMQQRLAHQGGHHRLHARRPET